MVNVVENLSVNRCICIYDIKCIYSEIFKKIEIFSLFGNTNKPINHVKSRINIFWYCVYPLYAKWENDEKVLISNLHKTRIDSE